jgi:riboflavin synthase
MFTGIIEATGIVKEISASGTNKTFLVGSTLSTGLSIDQSVCHDGVCLTVEAVENGFHQVTAVEETLKKTCLNNWQAGSIVNLERCLKMNGRLDGHIVQGHVDAVITCKEVLSRQGSTEYAFSFDSRFSALVIEKGSITVNGISLTCFDVTSDAFRVTIIPYTIENTNMQQLKAGQQANVEFDMIGKYVNRYLQTR